MYCAGKTTLIGEALGRVPGLQYIVTYTTREPRPAERDSGTHEYVFVTQAEYDRRRKMPDWDHTEVRGVSYGADAAAVNRQVEQGRSFIVVTTMEPEQIRQMRGMYSGEVRLLFLDTDFETCRQRALAPGSGRSEKYLADPTQTPQQAGRIRRMADYMYKPAGLLEIDGVGFSDVVRSILA